MMGRCELCDKPVSLFVSICRLCLEAMLMDPENDDATEPEPIFTIAVAFAGKPLCETRGAAGLMATMPQLEPGLYMIHQDDHIVADATRYAGGWWLVEFYAGVTLSPGCIVV